MQTNAQPLLSIIIPVFRVEEYLEKCLFSILKQKFDKDKYEIICVNDGSPDNCEEIVKTMQLEYPNIVLYNQKNQGVSAARNKGIQLSKGKYLLFVDPDDFLNRDVFTDLIFIAEQYDLEMIHSPLTELNLINDQQELNYHNNLNKVIEAIDLYYSIRDEKVKFPDRCHAILFKSTLIKSNNLYFVTGVPFLEDGEFMVRASSMAKRGYIYNVPYYTRLIRADSATSSDLSIQNKSLQGYFLAIQNLSNFKLINDLDENQVALINEGIAKFSILTIQKTLFRYKQFLWVRGKLIENKMIKIDILNINSKRYRNAIQFNKSLTILYLKLTVDHIVSFARIKLNNIKFDIS